MKDIITGMSVDEYNELPGTRSSSLKWMNVSPLHYQYFLKNSTKSTPSMIRGTALHAAILEPHRFASDFGVYPGPVRRGKEWEAWASAHKDKTIITAAEHAFAVRVADAIRKNHLAAGYLRDGQSEVVLQWKDSSGIQCKGRIDWLIPGEKPVIVGIKSAKSADKKRFEAAAANMLYTLQWAMYYEGFRAITGKTPEMVEIVVESGEPHDVAVYEIGTEVLTKGLEQFQVYIAMLQACEKTGQWPGLGEKSQVLELPGWLSSGEEDPKLDIDGEEV